MSVIALAQCSCGIFFQTPFRFNDAYAHHYANLVHLKSLQIKTCGPCFMGACKACDQNRSSREWQCKCAHDKTAYTTDADDERLSLFRLVWANWLFRGRNQEPPMKGNMQ